MRSDTEKHKRYLALLDQYSRVVVKVCYIFSSDRLPFDDLYQEVCINIWQGLDSFRGESSWSTWIYRTAINTCITWQRYNKRYNNNVSIDTGIDIVDDNSGSFDHEQYKLFQQLLAELNPLEKALITLRLDQHSYDEIAEIVGMSKSNVAVKLHRIKEKLVKRGKML